MRRAIRTGVLTKGRADLLSWHQRRAAGLGPVLRGLEVDGAAPELVRAFRVSRPSPGRGGCLEAVLEVELAAVAVVAFYDVEDGLAQVGEREQQALLPPSASPC